MDLGESLFHLESDDQLYTGYVSPLFLAFLLDIAEQWIQAKDVTTSFGLGTEIDSFHEGGKVGWLDVFDLEALFP